MFDLKTLLSPFRVDSLENPVTPGASIGKPRYVKISEEPKVNNSSTRLSYKTEVYEVDRIFKISSSAYNDGMWGSVSIRVPLDNAASTNDRQPARFFCATQPEDIDALIEALQMAKEHAFPEGGDNPTTWNWW